MERRVPWPQRETLMLVNGRAALPVRGIRAKFHNNNAPGTSTPPRSVATHQAEHSYVP